MVLAPNAVDLRLKQTDFPDEVLSWSSISAFVNLGCTLFLFVTVSLGFGAIMFNNNNH